MKHVLLLSLILIGCGKLQTGPQAKALSSSPTSHDSIGEAPAPSLPQTKPAQAAPAIANASGLQYLPMQVFSANDFMAHSPLDWTEEQCSGLITFDDFTIYSNASGTFFNSIPEDISIDMAHQLVKLTSNKTGHLGLTFSYNYEGAGNWEVYYGPNCGRLYQYAL